MHFFANQKGIFSPFMFGLLLAVGVFSVLSQQWAKRDLRTLQESRETRMEATAQDIARNIEFEILTETASTFSNNLNTNRLLPNAAKAGSNRSQDDIQIISREGEEIFELETQRFAINLGGDDLSRSALNQTTTSKNIVNAGETQGVAVIDTSAIRQRQVETSRTNMKAMAERIFNFYAGNLRFPTVGEYDQLALVFNATDVWGSPLDYTYENDDRASLAFTTPWGFRQSMRLDLKDN